MIHGNRKSSLWTIILQACAWSDKGIFEMRARELFLLKVVVHFISDMVDGENK